MQEALFSNNSNNHHSKLFALSVLAPKPIGCCEVIEPNLSPTLDNIYNIFDYTTFLDYVKVFIS